MSQQDLQTIKRIVEWVKKRLLHQCQYSNWCWFPCPQITPLFTKEAHHVAIYSQFVVGPVLWIVNKHSSRLSTSVHNQGTQSYGRQEQQQLGLFTTWNGMATYIQRRLIPERSHQITKVMGRVQKCTRPDLVPSDHPKSIASVLGYETTLANDQEFQTSITFSQVIRIGGYKLPCIPKRANNK